MINKIIINFIKHNSYVILLLITSFIFLAPMLGVGSFYSHDGVSHIVREAARYKALVDGQFPTRWAGDLNYGFGSPALIFYYSLNGYMGVFLHLFGFSLEFTYKLLLVGAFTLAPISFFYWVKNFFSKKIAFVTSLFYSLAPYSLLDLYVRGHVGESLALAILPFVLIFIQRNIKKITGSNIILGAIAYSLLIQSHGILSIIFSFVFAGYILVTGFRSKKLLVANASILSLGLILAAYFWMPSIFEGKYINSRLFVSNLYKDHFLNIGNIIYSKWGFGPDVNKPGGLSAQIGPLHSLFVLFSLIFLKKFKEKLLPAFWIIVFIAGVFMSLSVSDFLWSRIHILQQFQFPWRFSAATTFSACILAGYVLSFLKSNKAIAVSLALLFLLAIPMTKTIGVKPLPDSYYLNYPGTGTYHNEATTIWVAGDAYQYALKRVQVISGDGTISNYTRKSNLHEFFVTANSSVKILDNTVYFPGWRVEVDGKKTPIEFQDMNNRGLITFDVPKGKHNIDVVFGESIFRLFSDIVSLVGIVLVLAYLINLKLKLIKYKI